MFRKNTEIKKENKTSKKKSIISFLKKKVSKSKTDVQINNNSSFEDTRRHSKTDKSEIDLGNTSEVGTISLEPNNEYENDQIKDISIKVYKSNDALLQALDAIPDRFDPIEEALNAIPPQENPKMNSRKNSFKKFLSRKKSQNQINLLNNDEDQTLQENAITVAPKKISRANSLPAFLSKLTRSGNDAKKLRRSKTTRKIEVTEDEESNEELPLQELLYPTLYGMQGFFKKNTDVNEQRGSEIIPSRDNDEIANLGTSYRLLCDILKLTMNRPLFTYQNVGRVSVYAHSYAEDSQKQNYNLTRNLTEREFDILKEFLNNYINRYISLEDFDVFDLRSGLLSLRCIAFDELFSEQLYKKYTASSKAIIKELNYHLEDDLKLVISEDRNNKLSVSSRKNSQFFKNN